MSTKHTKFPKNSNRSIHQGTTIVGKNGLAIDALATLEPGISLVKGEQSFSYTSPTVTVHSSIDLTSLINYDSKNYKFTGILLFTDSSGSSYFIDQDSIDNTAKTFNIYAEADYTNSPSNITIDSDWVISEANLVNRLQTTSSAVIDNVEFRDVDVKLNLDGDPVTVRGKNNNTIEPNADGSINIASTNLDIRELDYLTDSVEARQSEHDNLNANVNIQVDNTDVSDNNPVPTSIVGVDITDNSLHTKVFGIHDNLGNEITEQNPLQVSTNYEKILQVILKSNWMNLANYDEVITSVSVDRQLITIQFKEDGYIIGEASVNFISDLSWNFILERYLVEDNGSKLLDDDDEPLFLE